MTKKQRFERWQRLDALTDRILKQLEVTDDSATHSLLAAQFAEVMELAMETYRPEYGTMNRRMYGNDKPKV